MPIAYDKIEHAEDYTLAKRTLEDCNEQGGIELQSKEKNEDNEGYTTIRFYRCHDRIPSIIKWAVPKYFTCLKETCINTFPSRIYTYELPTKPGIFGMKLNSVTKPYKYGDEIEKSDDVETLFIDVVNWDPIAKVQKWRVDDFESPEAGIERLPKLTKNNKQNIPEWVTNYKGPMSMIIKELSVTVNIFGISSVCENLLASNIMPNVFTETHRAIIGYSNEWCKMTDAEIEKYEDESYGEVNRILKENNCI